MAKILPVMEMLVMRLLVFLLVMVWCPTKIPVTKQCQKPRVTNPKPKPSPLRGRLFWPQARHKQAQVPRAVDLLIPRVVCLALSPCRKPSPSLRPLVEPGPKAWTLNKPG